jgi:integrase
MQENNARGPTAGRKDITGLVRAFLNWCADRPEYRDRHADACRTAEVKDQCWRRRRQRMTACSGSSCRLWFEHVRQLQNPVIAAYLQTALLTGARREELAGLQWADVDFQWKSVTIKDKVEGERIIPLTPYVAALLAVSAAPE